MQLREQNIIGDAKVWSGKNPNQKKLVDDYCKENNFIIGEEWQRAGINWLSNNSASQELDLFYYGYIRNPENRHKFSRHSRMEFGKFVDEGSGYIVNGEMSYDQVLQNIFDSAKRYEPSSADETDKERVQHYLTIVENYLKHTIDVLYGLKEQFGTMLTQYPLVLKMEGLRVLFIGFADFVFIKDGKIAKVVELKTMWSNPKGFYKKDYRDKKKGDRIWNKQSIPLEPRAINLPQIAIYSFGLNHPLDIMYVNEDEAVLMENEDYPQIQWDNLKEVLKYVRVNAITRQNLLSLVRNPKDLFQIIQPDFSHWKWRGVEKEYLDDAKKLWLNQKGKQ